MRVRVANSNIPQVPLALECDIVSNEDGEPRLTNFDTIIYDCQKNSKVRFGIVSIFIYDGNSATTHNIQLIPI